MLDAGIQVETTMRTVGRCVTRNTPDDLPNAHVNGSGPAIVFVNGWSASGLVWPRTLVDDLSRDHTVVRVDNRGTGWSHRLANPFTIRDLADDVIRVIDHLGIDPRRGRRSVDGRDDRPGVGDAPPRPSCPSRLDGHASPNPAYVPPASDVTAQLMSPPPPGQPLSDFMLDRWIGVTGPGFAKVNPEAIEDMVSTIVERPSARTAVLHRATPSRPGTVPSVSATSMSPRPSSTVSTIR